MDNGKFYFTIVNEIAREFGNGWFFTKDLAVSGLGDEFTCDTLYQEGYLHRMPIKELFELQIYKPSSFKYKLKKKRKVPNERTESISSGSD